MLIHLLFDALSYLTAYLVSKYLITSQPNAVPLQYKENYYTVIIIGFVTGAIFLGSLNIYLSQDEKVIIGKSILGALFGAIFFIEIYKRIVGISVSTGAYFVPSLAIGIAIGRIGCFFAGLEDFTYGIKTDFFLGYNFGDNIPRHPVQLYESVVMMLFFLYSLWLYHFKKSLFEQTIFYQFIFIYASSRFIWEFLKPYETVFLGLNIFQLVCLVLVGYAFVFLKNIILKVNYVNKLQN